MALLGETYFPGLSQLVVSPTRWNARYRAAAPMLEVARCVGLSPTPWAVEALAYFERAKLLQAQNQREWAGEKFKRKSCGDALMDAIPIYDTVERRYAGFSNVLEALWYGEEAPKAQVNLAKGRPLISVNSGPIEWLYICLVHRMTGSGASFEHDHGWRNTIVPEMAQLRKLTQMAEFVRRHPGPSGTSIGNQFPMVSKTKHLNGARNHLQRYLAEDGPVFAINMGLWFEETAKAGRGWWGNHQTIKETVAKALEINQKLGQKRFIFQLTAWAMDVAEYLPHWVDKASDCLHGKNAQEALRLCFDKARGAKMGRQEFYDLGTRVFCDATGTNPMDVEDAAPGCDLVRWVENYVPRNGFEHVVERDIFNSSSLRYNKGRQPSV
jgi:hypothetical protein